MVMNYRQSFDDSFPLSILVVAEQIHLPLDLPDAPFSPIRTLCRSMQQPGVLFVEIPCLVSPL